MRLRWGGAGGREGWLFLSSSLACRSAGMSSLVFPARMGPTKRTLSGTARILW